MKKFVRVINNYNRDTDDFDYDFLVHNDKQRDTRFDKLEKLLR